MGGPESYRRVVMGAGNAKSEKQAWTADARHRRSMRVLLSVPITVAGESADRRRFEEETRTLVVNAHGALIALGMTVANGQTITISNKATQASQECRIVYLGSPQGGKTQMGVEFVSPTPAFWQIDSPPDDWVVPEN